MTDSPRKPGRPQVRPVRGREDASGKTTDNARRSKCPACGATNKHFGFCRFSSKKEGN